MEAASFNIQDYIPHIVLLQISFILWIAISGSFIRKSFNFERKKMPVFAYIKMTSVSLIIILGFTGVAVAYALTPENIKTDLPVIKSGSDINVSVSIIGTRQIVIDESNNIIEVWSNAGYDVENYIFKITKETVSGKEIEPNPYIIAEFNEIINKVDFTKNGKVWDVGDFNEKKSSFNSEIIIKDGTLFEIKSIY